MTIRTATAPAMARGDPATGLGRILFGWNSAAAGLVLLSWGNRAGLAAESMGYSRRAAPPTRPLKPCSYPDHTRVEQIFGYEIEVSREYIR